MPRAVLFTPTRNPLGPPEPGRPFPRGGPLLNFSNRGKAFQNQMRSLGGHPRTPSANIVSVVPGNLRALLGGAVAQLGARLDGIEEVVGSNPIGSTKSEFPFMSLRPL